MFGKRQTTLEHIEHLDLRADDDALRYTAEPEPVAPVAVMERIKSSVESFDNDSDLEKLDHEAVRLAKERNSLFGVEAEADLALLDKINELQSKQRKARAFHRFDGEKLRLSNEVLTWRKPELLASVPQPEVGLFGLGMASITLNSEWERNGKCNPKLPHGITTLYADVFEAPSRLNQVYGFRSTHHLMATFSGVIPLETKEKIRDVQDRRIFSDIRLLAETEWKLDIQPNPFYADPIVVGLVEDEMWVIDIFDPTPLEDYIAKEFVI